jgi:hypothetical protein
MNMRVRSVSGRVPPRGAVRKLAAAQGRDIQPFSGRSEDEVVSAELSAGDHGGAGAGGPAHEWEYVVPAGSPSHLIPSLSKTAEPSKIGYAVSFRLA